MKGIVTAQCDRQGKRLPGGIGPVNEILAAGIADVVVGRAIGRITPDPDNMETIVGSGLGHGAIGIHPSEPAGQWLIEQAPPFPGFLVVNIVEIVTTAAATVTVTEDKPPLVVGKDNGIGHTPLAVAHHGRDPLERCSVHRGFAAEIDQRRNVHVAREMKEALPIQCHGYGVVGIPAERRWQLRDGPFPRVELALGDAHPTFRAVIGHPLMRRVGEQAETDRVTGPYRLHWDLLLRPGGSDLGGKRISTKDFRDREQSEGEDREKVFHRIAIDGNPSVVQMKCHRRS